VVDERTLAIGKWYARGHGDKGGKARKGRAEDRRQKTEDSRQKTEDRDLVGLMLLYSVFCILLFIDISMINSL